MVGKAARVRPSRREHDPLRNGVRFPAEWLDDDCRQAPSAPRHREQVVDVRELGLDLDKKQGSARCLPRDEVNDPALAEVAERDFRPHLKSSLGQQPGHGLGHPGMPFVHDAVEGSTSPARLENHPDLECCRGPAQRVEPDAPDVPTLDPRIGRRRDMRLRRNIDGPPASSNAKLPEHSPDRQIVHERDDRDRRLPLDCRYREARGLRTSRRSAGSGASRRDFERSASRAAGVARGALSIVGHCPAVPRSTKRPKPRVPTKAPSRMTGRPRRKTERTAPASVKPS